LLRAIRLGRRRYRRVVFLLRIDFSAVSQASGEGATGFATLLPFLSGSTAGLSAATPQEHECNSGAGDLCHRREFMG